MILYDIIYYIQAKQIVFSVLSEDQAAQCTNFEDHGWNEDTNSVPKMVDLLKDSMIARCSFINNSNQATAAMACSYNEVA